MLSVLSWVAGILLLLLGILMLFGIPLAGVSLIIAGGILLPPVNKMLSSTMGIVLSAKIKGTFVIILLVGFAIVLVQGQNKEFEKLAEQQRLEQAAKAEQERQAVITEFKVGREEIFASARDALSANDYEKIISEYSQYAIAEDEDLKRMMTQAQKALAEVRKAEKTEHILAELKSLPTAQFADNLVRYKQLLELHPKSKAYKDKVSFYSDKVEEERRVRAAKASAAAKAKELTNKWTYTSRSNEMSDRNAKFASVLMRVHPRDGVLSDQRTIALNQYFGATRGAFYNNYVAQRRCAFRSPCTKRVNLSLNS